MTDLEGNNVPRDKIWTQVFAAFSACIGGFAMGSCLSYTSPAIPSMRESSTFASMSLNEESWFASIGPLAAMIACPCIGLSIEQIGRKGSILMLTLPLLLGWILIAFGTNWGMLDVGRVLTGFTGGAYSVVVPIYINETAHQSIRGRLGVLTGIGMHTGICFPYVAGYFLAYDYLALTLCVVPMLIVALMVFATESPRYLLGKGHLKKATKSLIWLRRKDDVQEELDLIQKSIDKSKEEKFRYRDIFVTPAILKPTALCLMLMVFQVTSGIDAVICFNYTIFEASGTNFSPTLSSIVFGVVQVVAMALASLVIDKLGRRPLLLVSEISMVVSLATLGGFFYLSKYDSSIPERFGWLPLTSVVVYAIGFAFGIGPIPWIYLEILPTHVVGFASGIATFFNWCIAFFITRFVEELNEEIGREWSFWIFAIFSLFGTFFVYFCVPETKGKTLEEIQMNFN